MRYYTMGMVSESNLDIPQWIIFLAMPIGAALLFRLLPRQPGACSSAARIRSYSDEPDGLGTLGPGAKPC